MRKFILPAVFVLLMCNVCWGAVSEDMSVYLRKDVFEARMDAFMKEMRGEFQVMNAKLEALSQRMDDNYRNLEQKIDDNRRNLEQKIDDNRRNLEQKIDSNYHNLEQKIDDNRRTLEQKIDSNYHNLEQRIDNNYHSLDTRISDVRNDVYLGLVILGIIVSLPIVQKMLSSMEVKRQMITLEDVKRLIEENNAELRKSLQV